MNPKPLTFSERVAYAFFRRLYNFSTGDEQGPLVEEAMRVMGVRGFLRYMGFLSKFIKLMNTSFGEANTQTLIGLSALMTGCGYCGYGHTLTGALIWFKERDALHPIHPFSIAELFELEDPDVMERLDELLSEPGYEELRRLTHRMYSLFLGEIESENEEDELLKGILDFWRWTMECSIVEGVSITPENARTINEIGRDKALRRRYEAARAAQREGATAH